MALVVLSVVEQRLDAVRAVLGGADVVEVAARVGVHRSTVHRWVARYLVEQLSGLADRSHRPHGQLRQVPEAVEVALAEMRREHPRWGSRRIRLELLRGPLPWSDPLVVVPSERTIDRVLIRAGLVPARPRKRARGSYLRFERPGPMQLWGIDIVGPGRTGSRGRSRRRWRWRWRRSGGSIRGGGRGGSVNRPGSGGGSQSMEDESCGSTQEVPR